MRRLSRTTEWRRKKARLEATNEENFCFYHQDVDDSSTTSSEELEQCDQNDSSSTTEKSRSLPRFNCHAEEQIDFVNSQDDPDDCGDRDGDDRDGDDGDGDDGDGDDGDGDDGDGDDPDGGDPDGGDPDGGDPDGDDPDGDDPDGGDPDGDDSDDSDGDGPDDPDPDDPDDPDELDLESSDDSDEENGNFNFDHGDLNIVCESLNQCTVREVLALVLALASRHSWTYEATINTMKVINGIHGQNFLPIDKKPLWNLLGRRAVGIYKSVYCPVCLAGLGRLHNLPDIVNCECGNVINKRKCKVFINLNLKNQLRDLLRRQDVRQALVQQDNQDRMGEGMRDITDGQQYRRMRNRGNVLESCYSFSYTFSSDGFRLAKSSTAEAWPVYVRWNELPWKMRQKYVLLAGVWVDLQHPDMNLLLEKFVEQANDLSTNGVLWDPAPGRAVISKFVPTCLVVDAQARCKMLNLNSPSGYCCCPFCKHRGLYTGAAIHYPYLPPIPVPERRTDNEVRENMVQAEENRAVVNGYKGPSQLLLLDHFDLVKGIVTDDLHPFSGVVELHLTLLMTRTREHVPPYYIGHARDVSRIDSRLQNIRTPTHLSRKPRLLKTRNRWNGSEWRNFLLYYLVPALDGILPPRYLRHFQLLAQAVFIVSRDVVTEDDCNVAEDLFREYVSKFESYFGRENMRYNVHILLHVTDCVRNWGPMYCHSTTFFEAWNHELLKTVTSPHATAEQIVTRYLIWRFLNNIDEAEDISDRVKTQVRTLLDNPRLRESVRIRGVSLLGKCSEREASPEEQQLLERHGYTDNVFVEYKRAIFNNVEFRSAGYRYAGEETKSDNSQVHTWDDEFCQILTIAAVDNGADRRVVLFLKVYNTNALVNRYISRVNNGDELIVLKTFEQIRSLSILCTNPCGTYVMPVANAIELD